MKDALVNLFDMEYMDALHMYGDVYGNIRYYHRRKAAVVKKFIEKYSGKDKVFLDAGAGRGPYSMMARPLNKKIYVYEYDEKELTVAQTHLTGPDMEFRKVDLTSIPLPDASIDLTVCSEVLEHIRDEHKASGELTRVLKPGGMMLFSMPNAFSLFYLKVRMLMKNKNTSSYAEWEKVRHISFPFWKIEKLATAHGLKIISRRGVNVLPMPYVVRKFFMKKFPFGLRVWVALDNLLGTIFPFFGSFYFITLKK